MALNNRNIHRDLGYFYLGLIVSFAFSGILLNHRQTWHPEKYTVDIQQVTLTFPQNEAEITEDFVKGLTKQLGFEDKFRRHVLKKDELKINKPFIFLILTTPQYFDDGHASWCEVATNETPDKIYEKNKIPHFFVFEMTIEN